MNHFFRIRSFLKNEGADAFIILNNENSGQPNTRYLSGFSGTSSILFVTAHGQYLITDGRYIDRAEEECRDVEIMSTRGTSPLKIVGDISWKQSVRKILFDSARTTHAEVERLKQNINGVAFVPASGVFEEMRMVKDESELKSIRRASEIAVRAFEKLLPSLKAGITERLVAAKLEFLMREEGAEKIAFETIVASGIHGAQPHAKVTDKKIEKGDLVTIDFGAVFEGYSTDVTRTIAIGEPAQKLLEIYEVVREAQALGRRKARAGISGEELDKIVRDYVNEKGYGEYFVHGTGHGVGMEVHEFPYISKGSVKPLQENSVITCEPGIYIPGVGGVRIEDTLVVTKKGSENLTGRFSTELITV